MSVYTVKEVFRTLQGEGFHAGRAAVFCRFAGCNLWSGREEDRLNGPGSCSRWCDTDFRGGAKYDASTLAQAIFDCWPEGVPDPFVVLTGGEPLLQVDEPLTRLLREYGFTIAVETNGTQELPPGIDWVTFSPKGGRLVRVGRVDELKFVYPQAEVSPSMFDRYATKHRYIQPMAGMPGSTKAAVEFVQQNPQWRLSLQTHKLIGLP